MILYQMVQHMCNWISRGRRNDILKNTSKKLAKLDEIYKYINPRSSVNTQEEKTK